MRKYALVKIDFIPNSTILIIDNIKRNAVTGWMVANVYNHLKGDNALYGFGETVYIHDEHVIFKSDKMKEVKERAMLEIL